jgi:hypothetical protein
MAAKVVYLPAVKTPDQRHGRVSLPINHRSESTVQMPLQSIARASSSARTKPSLGKSSAMRRAG